MSDLARRRTLFFLGLFMALLASRLCHLHILWAEEGYGSAGAVQILHGKMIYRDFWFDKPPVAALLYVLWGGTAGWALRLAGSLFGLLTAFSAWRCASALWSEREGYWAAGLVTFFLILDIPAAVMTLGPDLIVVPLAFAAIGCVLKNEPVWAGLWCAVAVQTNAKALLLVTIVLIWGGRRQVWKIVPAFVGGAAVGVGWLAATGSLHAYWTQVWEFGRLYSRDTFVEDPVREGVVRSLNWLGFHLALAVPAVIALMKEKGTTRWRFSIWLCLAATGVWAGERYFPRYYLILLPPVTLLAARGFVLLSGWYRKAGAAQSGTADGATSLVKVAPSMGPQWRLVFYGCLALLLIPLVRFGPRYALLAEDLLSGRPHKWTDVALNQDSQEVASEISEVIRSRGINDPTLLVWGYRPDLFAYTRLPAGTPYLDSQLLTGVIADRHLTNDKVSLPGAEQNRLGLTESRPTFIVDGLGPLNPKLAITEYPELRSWLAANYEEVGRTKDSVVYGRRSGDRTGARSSDSVGGRPKMCEVDNFDAIALEHQVKVKVVCQDRTFLDARDCCDRRIDKPKTLVDRVICCPSARDPFFGKDRNCLLQYLSGSKSIKPFKVGQVADLRQNMRGGVDRLPAAELSTQQVEVFSRALTRSLEAFDTASIYEANHE